MWSWPAGPFPPLPQKCEYIYIYGAFLFVSLCTIVLGRDPVIIMLAHGPGPMAHGPGPMAHRPWLMAHGPWPMAYGPGPMAHGPWPMAHGPGPRAQGPGPMARPKNTFYFQYFGMNGPQIGAMKL